MPFILAIEPDPRQASRVEALAPEHIDAEIIVVGSVDAALDALRTRKPDLVLTPLLLSAKDDGLLTRRLREFDADGSQLPTLVIPVLDSAERRPSPLEKPASLLNRLRRMKVAASSASGCAPAVFAAQITEYLARIAAERGERDEARRANEWAAPSAGASAPMLGEWLTVPVLSPWVSRSDSATTEDVPPTAALADDADADDDAEAVALSTPFSEPEAVESPAAEPIAASQSQESPELYLQPGDNLLDPEVTIEASWEDLESFLEDLEIEQGEFAVEVVAAADETEPDVIDLPSPDELWATLEGGQHQAMAPLEGPTMTKKRPAPATKTSKATRPSPNDARPVEPRRPRRPKAPTRPMQDEWGLYDPEQCGFAALLERLQELNEPAPPRKGRRGRSAIMRR